MGVMKSYLIRIIVVDPAAIFARSNALTTETSLLEYTRTLSFLTAALLTGVLFTAASAGGAVPVESVEGDAVDTEVTGADVVAPDVVELGATVVAAAANVVASGDEVMCEVCLKP